MRKESQASEMAQMTESNAMKMYSIKRQYGAVRNAVRFFITIIAGDVLHKDIVSGQMQETSK